MEIAIFNKITTEGVITSIEENSKKYHVGFYADMNNAPERKLVKESASEIGGIIKELEAARISITKANTLAVNKEHKLILERLQVANAPFQVLIDEYTEQRKKILADEKRVIELRAAMVQKEDDHEMGLLINKTFEYDKAEQLKAEQKIQFEIKILAEESARISHDRIHERIIEKEKQDRINAKNARLADIKHVRKVNTDILFVLVSNGISEEDSKTMIRLAAKKELPQLTINY
jgi:hypothetical protein